MRLTDASFSRPRLLTTRRSARRWHYGNRTDKHGAFIPQSGGAFDQSVGAIAMPGVVSKLRQIGRAIISGTDAPQGGPTLGRGRSNTLLDVRKLGAKGDGVTNDHAVIAGAFAAAAAAAAAGGTATVVLPAPGVYIVDAPLLWNASHSLLSIEKGAVLRWFWDKELRFAQRWGSYETMFSIRPTDKADPPLTNVSL